MVMCYNMSARPFCSLQRVGRRGESLHAWMLGWCGRDHQEQRPEWTPHSTANDKRRRSSKKLEWAPHSKEREMAGPMGRIQKQRFLWHAVFRDTNSSGSLFRWRRSVNQASPLESGLKLWLALTKQLPTRGDFAFYGTFDSVWRQFCLSQFRGRGWCYWHPVGGGQGGVTDPRMHSAVPITKNYSAQNVNSAKVEKLKP